MIQIFNIIRFKVKKLHNGHLDKFNNKNQFLTKIRCKFLNKDSRTIKLIKTRNFNTISQAINNHINNTIINFKGITIIRNKNKHKLSSTQWIP